MIRSNLIPITRIYDIYPKYTYSDDVKKFMDEIVDIDRANVYTKDEVIAMLEELDFRLSHYQDTDLIRQDIQQKIDKLKGEEDGNK